MFHDTWKLATCEYVMCEVLKEVTAELKFRFIHSANGFVFLLLNLPLDVWQLHLWHTQPPTLDCAFDLNMGRWCWISNCWYWGSLHGANLELDGIIEASAHLLDGLAAVISSGVHRPDCSFGGSLTTYAPLMDADCSMSQWDCGNHVAGALEGGNVDSILTTAVVVISTIFLF